MLSSDVIGTITANGQSVTLDTDEQQSAVVYWHLWGVAHAGVNLTFEGTRDGTNWATVIATRVDATGVLPSTVSGTITSNAYWVFSTMAANFTKMRVRATAYTSGTLTVHGLRAPDQAMINIGSPVSISGIPTVNTSPVTPTTHTLPSSAATTNATVIKASGGTIVCMSVSNVGAAIRYFKVYDKASAPTVGTDVPVKVVPLAAGSTYDLPTNLFRLNTGIAYAITGALADADTTAIGAGEVKVVLSFY